MLSSSNLTIFNSHGELHFRILLYDLPAHLTSTINSLYCHTNQLRIYLRLHSPEMQYTVMKIFLSGFPLVRFIKSFSSARPWSKEQFTLGWPKSKIKGRAAGSAFLQLIGLTSRRISVGAPGQKWHTRLTHNQFFNWLFD